MYPADERPKTDKTHYHGYQRIKYSVNDGAMRAQCKIAPYIEKPPDKRGPHWLDVGDVVCMQFGVR